MLPEEHHFAFIHTYFVNTKIVSLNISYFYFFPMYSLSITTFFVFSIQIFSTWFKYSSFISITKNICLEQWPYWPWPFQLLQSSVPLPRCGSCSENRYDNLFCTWSWTFYVKRILNKLNRGLGSMGNHLEKILKAFKETIHNIAEDICEYNKVNNHIVVLLYCLLYSIETV